MFDRLRLEMKLILNIIDLKKFSTPDFEGVYSKQYYDSLLVPLFSNPNSNFSYIFGDFNKLNDINTKYGHKSGDIALKNSINLIKQVLPKDAVISRLGGDEFSIIIPDSNINDCKEYIKSINSTLSKNASSTFGLSIELSGVDSSFGNIHELYKITEKEVTDKKNKRKKDSMNRNIISDDFLPLDIPKSNDEDEGKYWNDLNNLTNVSIYNFLQNLRISNNFVFGKSQLTDGSKFVLTSISDLLNEQNYTNLKNLSDNLNTEQNNSLDYVTAFFINEFIKKDTFNLDVLTSNTLEEINSKISYLLEKNIRDEHSNLLSKSYFRLFLADALSRTDKNYQGIYFSTSGIKISNTAFGHEFTDKKLEKTSNLLITKIKEKFNFNNESFNYSDDNTYFLSQGGGNFLLLIPQDHSITQEDLDVFLANINDSVDIDNPYSHFYLSSAIENCISKKSKEDFISSVRKLKETANSNKDSFKKNIFKGTDIQVCFENSIQEVVNSYLNNISDASTDINKKSILLKNIMKSLFNYSSMYNKLNEKETKEKQK